MTKINIAIKQITLNGNQEVEKEVKPGWIVNRNHHEVTLSYDGEAMIIPPRGKEKICNVDKLGGLAPNVVFIPKK